MKSMKTVLGEGDISFTLKGLILLGLTKIVQVVSVVDPLFTQNWQSDNSINECDKK